jgi:hypothetical protein
MPGLKIVVGPPPSSLPPAEAEWLTPEAECSREQVYAGPRIEVTFAAPAHYPRLSSSSPDFHLFVEGLVYDRTDDELVRFAAEIAGAALAGRPIEEPVRRFMVETDGEYVFLLVLKASGRVIVFNDPWGRLPLYTARTPAAFLLGREPQDLLAHLPEIRFDRQAIAEWLAFEYTLNLEWFVEGIARVQPATLFDVSACDGDVRVAHAALLPQDFTVTKSAQDRDEAVRRYAALYLEAYEVRVAKLKQQGFRLTADLSGGFDTRAIFAGARRLDVPMEFYTDELVTGDESKAAELLAEAGDVPVVRVLRGPAIQDEAEWRRLVYLTGGRVNYATMLGALLLARARRKLIPGRAARFMGFVGELVRHPYVRPHGYRSFQDAMADDVYTSFIRIREGSRLVGLEPAKVHGRMAGAVERWSEGNDTDRARRLYFQYWYGLGQMGEDRHRWHFWTVTPILANKVLDLTYHGIKAKAVGYLFFVELLRTVYPRSLESPLHRSTMKLTSRRQVHAFAMKKAFLARLRNTRSYRKLRSILSPRERWITLATPERFIWYREQFDSAFRESEAVRATFDEHAVRAWVHPGQAIHRLDQLLTSVYFVAEVGRRFPTVRTN